MTRIDFNDDWLFEGRDHVRLPHNAVDLPFSYFDERAYQRPFTYEKDLLRRPSLDRARGHPPLRRRDGQHHRPPERRGHHPPPRRLYPVRGPPDRPPPPRPEPSLRHRRRHGKPDIPPFGAVIDYLTYAGLYREVWLDLKSPVHIGAVKIETPDALAPAKTVTARVTLANPQGLPLTARSPPACSTPQAPRLPKPAPPSPAQTPPSPLRPDRHRPLATRRPRALHTRTHGETPSGTDRTAERFGFRQIAFTPDGFHLNGQKIKLRGLNRHQSFPLRGLRPPPSAQVRDAEILKHDHRVNIVRTSHYPQSKAFLNRCDELGLMVFEEIPGWQHIGGINGRTRPSKTSAG